MLQIERTATAIAMRSLVRVAIALMSAAEWVHRRYRRRDPNAPDIADELGRVAVKHDRRNTAPGGRA